MAQQVRGIVIPEGLPRCVALVREKAKALVEAVNADTFPDLETDPTSIEQLEEWIGQAVEWGTAVNSVYGVVGDHYTDEFGLCGLFGPDMTADDESEHIPTLSWPRDVLGTLPGEFRESCTIVLMHMDPQRHRRMRSSVSERLLDYTSENWSEIRATLEVTRTVITAKALGLAMWANERIANLSGALVPTITWDSEGLYNNSIWRVQRAGFSRTVSLTDRESTFVTRLASGEPVAVHRGGYSSCLKKVVELRPWIRLVRSEARSGRDNESEYQVPKEIAAGIHPAPPGTDVGHSLDGA